MIQDAEHIRPGDDVWVPTMCGGCYNCCGIRVHRVDGRVVDVAGDPNAPNSQGYLCAKGKARFLDLYHPKRIKRPLRRTNPNKGMGEDPGWQTISWDEALDTIVAKLQAVREDDPRKLVLSHFDIPGYKISTAFGMAFKTPNFHWNRADVCGSGSHPVWLMTNGTLNSEIDFERCRYVVLWGTQIGHLVNTCPLNTASQLADARAKGAKLVVIDPFCSNAAAKADEWIPIKPGTDGALALAVLHVIVHELKRFDAPFLTSQTNGPYLVGPDGHYLRHPETHKPLMWDAEHNRAKAFDAQDMGQAALEGCYQVDGIECRTAFQVLCDHLAQIDVEEMSTICTVPVETIRRFADEFTRAAQIGSSVEVMGHKLPLRPAAIEFKRGSAAHRGGFNSCMAMHLINMLVGAVDVPGGQRGVNPKGPYWEPGVSEDGLLIPADAIAKYNKPYPGIQAQKPNVLDLRELFPVALFTRGVFPWGIDDPERFGLDYKPEVLIQGRTNLMMNSHQPEAMEKTLKRFSFIVSITTLIDETAEFADIILPDAHDFERWDLFPANDPYAFVAAGEGPWYWIMRQPAVEPPLHVRPWNEIYLELAERLGILDELYQIGNSFWVLDDKNKLEPGKHYTIREVAERQARTIVGPDFGWDQLTETSTSITRNKTVDEAYPRMFLPSRMPIYLEHFLTAKKEVQQVTQELGLEWDLTAYTAVPHFIPCQAHEKNSQYDLIATNHKLPFQTFSVSAENLWIDEISCANPYTYRVMLNTRVGVEKGLKTGDRVRVASPHGWVEGILRLTELLHPECVGIAGNHGHWARGLPVSAGKGAGFSRLLPGDLDLGRIDTLSGQFDFCVQVKISKC